MKQPPSEDDPLEEEGGVGGRTPRRGGGGSATASSSHQSEAMPNPLHSWCALWEVHPREKWQFHFYTLGTPN